MKKIFTLFAALAMVMSMSATPYLRGSFNGWGTGNEFVNGECSINLSANTTYEFKIADANWGNEYAGGKVITKTNCTDVSIPSGGNNAKITSDLAGTYIFKWNASSKKLTVIYPSVVLEKKDITVKAKMPASWGTTITAWVWTAEDGNGKAVTPEKQGDWYVVTQNTTISYVIFRNGNDWNGDKNQTVDLAFQESTCVELTQSGNSKATYTIVDCPDFYNVTVTAENGTVTGDGEYEEGKEATLTATPAEGYEFVNWTKGEEKVSTENPYTFTVTADVALVANFKKSVVTITKSFELTSEDVTNRFGRQTISVEDVDLGSVQLIIPGFSAEVSEYAEASLAIGDDEPLTATATYQNDTENNKEIYTAVATSMDGSKIYKFTFNVALPTTQNYELYAMGLSATVESEDGYTAYYMEGEAILGEELIPVEFMVDNFGNAEGMIGDIFAFGTGEAEQEGTSLFGVVLLEDESGNTYRIEFVAEIEQPEVEIVVKEEVDVVLYNLNVEPQGTMGLVSAGTEELSFWLTLLPTANYYGGYMSDAFSNIWYNDEQLYSAYGDMHLYGVDTDDKVKFVVSFITTPDAEGNVTKYNFTLYPGDKPSDATGVDNLNSTVAPIKAIINGQLIISDNGVQYNAQGAILK